MRQNLALLVAVAVGAPASVQGDCSDAARVLREKRLVRLRAGSVWVNEAELRLRDCLVRVTAISQRIQTTEQTLDRRVASNRTRWAARPAATPRLATGPSGAAVLRSVAPRELGSIPSVRRELIQLSSARCELALTISVARGAASRMVTHYEQISADPPTRRALTALGADQRLGPARDYAGDLRRLRELHRSVLTDWTPLYRQGQQFRFSGILNEQLPVTFSWGEDCGAILTFGVAEAGGIQIDPSQRQALVVDGRQFVGHRVRIPYLQFGSCILRGVPALVLPPEGEDLGCRIGRLGFAGYRVRLRPERLRVTIRAGKGS